MRSTAVIGVCAAVLALSFAAVANMTCSHMAGNSQNCASACTVCSTANPNGATSCSCDVWDAQVTFECWPCTNPQYDWTYKVNATKRVRTGACASGVCGGTLGAPETPVALYPTGSIACFPGAPGC